MLSLRSRELTVSSLLEDVASVAADTSFDLRALSLGDVLEATASHTLSITNELIHLIASALDITLPPVSAIKTAPRLFGSAAEPIAPLFASAQASAADTPVLTRFRCVFADQTF